MRGITGAEVERLEMDREGRLTTEALLKKCRGELNLEGAVDLVSVTHLGRHIIAHLELNTRLFLI